MSKYVDPIEQRHDATNARIMAGAKAGKYWLLRSEDREELIARIIETTTSGAIGGFNMGMGIAKNDPTMGGRNEFHKQKPNGHLSVGRSSRRPRR